MKKELFMKLTTEGKEVEMSISDPDNMTMNLLLASFVDFLDIEPFENLTKIEQLYLDFYDGSFNPEVLETNEEMKIVRNMNFDIMTTDELFAIGIKRFTDGNIARRCRYTCPECNNTGTRYIVDGKDVAICHECSNKMTIRPSSANSFNKAHIHYFAGDYK